MRGLTTLEYDVLVVVSQPEDDRPDTKVSAVDGAILWSLFSMGLIERRGRAPFLTPAGRKAMRLYEAERSSGVAS